MSTNTVSQKPFVIQEVQKNTSLPNKASQELGELDAYLPINNLPKTGSNPTSVGDAVTAFTQNNYSEKEVQFILVARSIQDSVIQGVIIVGGSYLNDKINKDNYPIDPSKSLSVKYFDVMNDYQNEDPMATDLLVAAASKASSLGIKYLSVEYNKARPYEKDLKAFFNGLDRPEVFKKVTHEEEVKNNIPSQCKTHRLYELQSGLTFDAPKFEETKGSSIFDSKTHDDENETYIPQLKAGAKKSTQTGLSKTSFYDDYYDQSSDSDMDKSDDEDDDYFAKPKTPEPASPYKTRKSVSKPLIDMAKLSDDEGDDYFAVLKTPSQATSFKTRKSVSRPSVEMNLSDSQDKDTKTPTSDNESKVGFFGSFTNKIQSFFSYIRSSIHSFLTYLADLFSSAEKA